VTGRPSSPSGGSASTPPSDVEPWALCALLAWLVITVGWWALALWPLPDASPEWLARARAVCFNATATGLPDASGWLLLVGQPAGMLGVLVVAWPRAVRSTLGALSKGTAGRVLLGVSGAIVLVGLSAAGARVAGSRAAAAVEIVPDPVHPVDPARDRPRVAPLDLVDQRGVRTTLARFAGRPILLTFAFGHCETVCPVVVRNARAVQDASPRSRRPVILVVTLDPWRDTPARLAHLADAWQLDQDGYALGGSVDEVNGVLDAWGIGRSRDGLTGDIVHAPTVFGIDPAGRLEFVSTGEIESLRRLVGAG